MCGKNIFALLYLDSRRTFTETLQKCQTLSFVLNITRSVKIYCDPDILSFFIPSGLPPLGINYSPCRWCYYGDSITSYTHHQPFSSIPCHTEKWFHSNCIWSPLPSHSNDCPYRKSHESEPWNSAWSNTVQAGLVKFTPRQANSCNGRHPTCALRPLFGPGERPIISLVPCSSFCEANL